MNRRTFLVVGGAAATVSTLGCRTNPPSPHALRALTYNLHHGEGTDGRVDLERIAGIVRAAQPDLVAFQEVDRRATRTGSP